MKAQLVAAELILYLTYQDLGDAILMWAAIPEALAGGVFFRLTVEFSPMTMLQAIKSWESGENYTPLGTMP